MAEIRLQGAGAISAHDPEALVGITDLQVVDSPNGPTLIATTRGDGWVTAFDLSGNHASILDSWAINQSRLQLESTDLVVLPRNGADQILLAGLSGSGMTGLSLSGNGQSNLFGSNTTYTASGVNMGEVSTLSVQETANGTFGLAGSNAGGLMVLDFDDNAQVSARAVASGQSLHTQTASAVTTIQSGGTLYGFAAFEREDAISSFRINSNGTATALSNVIAQDGVSAASGPTALRAVDVAGDVFLIVAAADSGSLSVFSVDASGQLNLTDQVQDNRDTRFADASHIETIDIDGRLFLAAAGSDSGISLFTLLPGGRLHHLDTVAATTDTPLRGISDVTFANTSDGLQIYVATQADPYLVAFDVSGLDVGVTLLASSDGQNLTGTRDDDVLVGRDGDDHLSGAAGLDVLMDGHGRDDMTGGGGADMFIFTEDGDTDTVTDFQRGVDQLDLTGLPGLWNIDDIIVVSRSWGAEVRYRNEVNDIRSSDGSPLNRADIIDSLILIDRLSMASASGQIVGSQSADRFDGGDAPEAYVGLNGNDHLMGEGGNDTLMGDNGNDRLSGGFGQDVLHGGAGLDVITGDAGFDTIYGDAGGDFLNGGGQADLIRGGEGNDRLLGENGYDNLYGDAGQDTLLGGDTADRLYGGDGDDVLSGGVNVGLTVDGLFGEAGNDTLLGDGGFDFLDGGDGDDHLDGGKQADNLYGRSGNDTLEGGDGLDRLFGGAGDDLGYGGAGNDGMFGEQGDDTLDGGDGNDRFFAGAGNDVLIGGDGRDEMHGGAGFDTITSGEGNDTITGDFNADTFIFSDGHGQDRIDDFEALNPFERIDLSDVSAISSFADLQANHLSQSGSYAVIDTGGGNAIALRNVAIADLGIDDFIF